MVDVAGDTNGDSFFHDRNPYRCAMTLVFAMEGARGIEPPPRFSGEASGFEDRGVPSTIAPLWSKRLFYKKLFPFQIIGNQWRNEFLTIRLPGHR